MAFCFLRLFEVFKVLADWIMYSHGVFREMSRKCYHNDCILISMFFFFNHWVELYYGLTTVPFSIQGNFNCWRPAPHLRNCLHQISLQQTYLRDIFLTEGLCGRAHLLVAGAIHVQVGLGFIRQIAEKIRRSKVVNNLPPGFLPQAPAFNLFFGFGKW